MAHDPTDVRAIDRKVEQRRDDQKRKREAAGEDMKLIMSTKEGRRFVWEILEFCGVYRSSFTGNSETFFKEGQRNVGLMLLGKIHEHCPDGFTTMLKEQKRE